MSFRTTLQNYRAGLALKRERMNAENAAAVTTTKTHVRALVPMFALAFVFMLASLATPVAAAEIDWTVLTGLLDNVSTTVMPAMVDFIVSVVPAIVVLSIIGFVITFLDKILAIFDKVFR